MSLERLKWDGTNLTREGRARNIFGISSCSYTRKYGQVGEDNKRNDRLAIMPTNEAGYHAAIELIRDHYLMLGNFQFFSPCVFGNKWSGDPAKKYGFNLAKMMRVNAWMPLPFRTWGHVLLRAVAIMENGDPCRDIPEGFFDQFIREDL